MGREEDCGEGDISGRENCVLSGSSLDEMKVSKAGAQMQVGDEIAQKRQAEAIIHLGISSQGH